MPFGGLHPFPMRFGGSSKRLQKIVESLNQQMGDAYDTSRDGEVYAENMAAARALDSAWSTNQRLANQWDPARMTTLLPRWEKIRNLYPLPTDTDQDRRAAVQRVANRAGTDSSNGAIIEELQAVLGDVYVDLEFIDISIAHVTTPDGSYSFGTASTVHPWSSTVLHVLIKTQKPTGYTEGQFYEAVAKIGPIMEALLPAWATYDWYRAGPISSVVSGGPSAGGFYLDDDHNLDNEVFD